MPKWLKKQINIRLIRFDVNTEEPVRGPNGLCEECRPGEIGEAIGLISADPKHDFSGYADKAASEKKILTDVFSRGDRWFRTGDLMRQDSEGYFYFIDRIGLRENLSPTRANGLLAMIKQMKLYALAYQNKQ